MPRRSPLTEQELEILKIASEREAITVRDIDEALLERRKVAYTALKKTLADRGYIYRRPTRYGLACSPVCRRLILSARNIRMVSVSKAAKEFYMRTLTLLVVLAAAASGQTGPEILTKTA